MALPHNGLMDPIDGRAPTEEQVRVIRELKEHFAELLAHIRGATPPSREQALAVTHLEDACMRATRAALQPRPQRSGPPEAYANQEVLA